MIRYDYLIIGNSAAAVGAIESIRSVDSIGSIGVVSDEEHPVYSRPRISDCITRQAGPETVAYRPADFYERYGVIPNLGKTASSLDAPNRSVSLESGETLGYGKLLLATGARPSQPPIPGVDLHGVHFFTRWDHAQRIADSLPDADEAVVIGGGLIGMQAAEALARVGVSVTVVEMLDRVLALAVDPHASELISAAFDKHGVRILTGRRVSSIEGKAGSASGVLLSDGELLPARIVIVAVGVTPRVELAVSAGLETRRGIVVDDHMRTSDTNIYAAGDAAEARDLLSGEFRLTPIWPNAYMEGRTAGSGMAGRHAVYPGGLSMNSAHFFDYPVLAAGVLDSCDGCTDLVSRNDSAGYYRRVILKDNTAVGLIMAGNAVDKAGVLLSLIRSRQDCSEFIDSLARTDFGIAHLPDELRMTKQLGREKL